MKVRPDEVEPAEHEFRGDHERMRDEDGDNGQDEAVAEEVLPVSQEANGRVDGDRGDAQHDTYAMGPDRQGQQQACRHETYRGRQRPRHGIARQATAPAT